MDIEPFDDDLVPDDGDWLEAQFFSQHSLRHSDLDWGPVAPLPDDERRAMHATFGLLAVAVIGLLAFVVYSQFIMPAPEPLGRLEPFLPPTAAGDSHVPNG
jgi:hypothetical protein